MEGTPKGPTVHTDNVTCDLKAISLNTTESRLLQFERRTQKIEKKLQRLDNVKLSHVRVLESDLEDMRLALLRMADRIDEYIRRVDHDQ